jgi:hypothetical protein
VVVGVLLMLTMATCVDAQDSDWEKVVLLKPGVRVRILGPDVSGFFVRATVAEVVIDRGGRTVTVPRSAVRRLDAAPGQDGFWRRARRGFIIGAVIGAVGFLVVGENSHGGRDVAVGSAVVGLIGGGLAGLGAVSEPDYKVVYATP